MSLSSLIALVLTVLLVVRPVPAQSLANAAPLVISIVNNDGGVSAPGSHEKKGFTLAISDSSGAPVADAAVVLRFPDSGPTATFGDGTHAAVAYTDATGRADVTGMQWSADAGTVAIKVTATKGTAHAGTIIEQQLSTATEAIAAPKPVVAMPAAVVAPVVVAPVEPKQQAAAVVQPGTPRTADQLPAPPAAVPAAPSISVINRPSSDKLDTGGGGHKKWIFLLIAVAAGAGAGLAFAGKKSSSSTSSTSTTSGTTIGTPTVNVGAP